MAKLFLDPNSPLKTCQQQSCAGCGVSSGIHCHFSWHNLALFLLFCMPALFIAGRGLWLVHTWMLRIWLAWGLIFFWFLEVRVMCSHCPHYGEQQGGFLKCWANYGAPRLWKYRMGPMSRSETLVFLSGLTLFFGSPLPILFYAELWGYCLAYLLGLAWFAGGTRRFFCSSCMNFACFFNRVDQKTRQEFWAQNPALGEAWNNAKSKDGALDTRVD